MTTSHHRRHHRTNRCEQYASHVRSGSHRRTESGGRCVPRCV